MSFYKTRNPAFALLLSIIENFLSRQTAIGRKKRFSNRYQKGYAMWMERNTTKEVISSSLFPIQNSLFFCSINLVKD